MYKKKLYTAFSVFFLTSGSILHSQISIRLSPFLLVNPQIRDLKKKKSWESCVLYSTAECVKMEVHTVCLCLMFSWFRLHNKWAHFGAAWCNLTLERVSHEPCVVWLASSVSGLILLSLCQNKCAPDDSRWRPLLCGESKLYHTHLLALCLIILNGISAICICQWQKLSQLIFFA